MNRSSALKSNLRYSDDEIDRTEQYTQVQESGSASANGLEFPDFSAYGGVATYAATARLAGRVNAANVSPSEHKDLLREREQLVLKQINNEITRKEIHRLEYVRWSLDRIEDARYGHTLDALESLVEYYEKFESDIQGLRAQLEDIRERK